MTEMNDQLSLENYSPFEVEKKWQEKWESLKAFSPNPVSYTHLTLPTMFEV